MAAEQTISRAECDCATVPLYSRTWEEWMAPFQPTEQPLFRVVHTALRRVVAPAWSRFRQSRDVAQLAADYAGSMEACCKRCLQKSVANRPNQEQQTIMATLFKRYQAQIASDPTESLGDYIILDLVKI